MALSICKRNGGSFSGYEQINYRIVTIKFAAKPKNITVIQVCAPTAHAEGDEREDLY